MKTFFHIFTPAIAFSYICACGWFIGWMGGMEPFTPNAGFLAFLTLSLASFSTIFVIDVFKKGY